MNGHSIFECNMLQVNQSTKLDLKSYGGKDQRVGAFGGLMCRLYTSVTELNYFSACMVVAQGRVLKHAGFDIAH